MHVFTRTRPVLIRMTAAGLVVVLALVAGCSKKGQVRTVKQGDQVTLSYTGTLADGKIFDQTPPDQPLVYTIGSGRMFPQMDSALVGMEAGEEKKVTILAQDAFGPRVENAATSIPRAQLPPDPPPQAGMALSMRDNRGMVHMVTITAVEPEFVTVDLNHPLAGQDLTFAIKLLAFSEPKDPPQAQ